MSKVVEKTIEEYPRHVIGGDNPYNRGYNAGYDQAMQDFLEKAKEFFIEKHIGMFTQFKNYMKNEI